MKTSLRNQDPVLLVNQSIGALFSELVAALELRVPVVLFRGVVYKRTSPAARLLTWSFYSLQLAFHLWLRGGGYHRLLIVSNPPFAPLLAPLARRPYALLLYDLYPQVLQHLRPHFLCFSPFLRPLVSLWNAANKLVFSRADRIFTLTDAMAEQLRPVFKTESLWREKVVVIPPWSPTYSASSSCFQLSMFRVEHGLDDRMLVSYSGNIGYTHPLEPLIDATSHLDGSVQVLFVGHGSKRNALEKRARILALGSDKIKFIDPIPPHHVPLICEATDLSVIALDASVASASLPSKTFTALAFGTPLLVLAPLNSALADLVLFYRCGVVVPPGPEAVHQIVYAIRRLSGDRALLKNLSTNALSASAHYTSANAELLVDSFLA
jgi:hypothetical protein